jgi:hypothetical protein
MKADEAGIAGNQNCHAKASVARKGPLPTIRPDHNPTARPDNLADGQPMVETPEHPVSAMPA